MSYDLILKPRRRLPQTRLMGARRREHWRVQISDFALYIARPAKLNGSTWRQNGRARTTSTTRRKQAVSMHIDSSLPQI